MTQRLSRVRLAGMVVGAMLAAGGTGCQTLDTEASPTPLFGETHTAAKIFDSGPLLSKHGDPLKGPLGGGQPAHIHPAPKADPVDDATLPKELNKVTMPEYVVEAPDILLIDAQRLVPLPPYRVEPLDVLYLFNPNAPDRDPINGMYPVDPDGTINMGPNYGGAVRVVDLTIPEIEKVLAAKLKPILKESGTTVSLAQARGVQAIRGDHLVRPDGTVSLGGYGAVYVAGLTLRQVKAAIEAHLSKYLYKPEVAVDVYAYNSKFYYVITDFAGSGAQVTRVPITGNETVLDALAYVGGLSAVSSNKLWVARPAPQGCGDQILPVDWRGISRRGSTKTNYQILPGDRVFVMAQPLSRIDNVMARTLAPVNRALGTALFGYSTYQTIATGGQFGFGGGNGGTTNVNVNR